MSFVCKILYCLTAENCLENRAFSPVSSKFVNEKCCWYFVYLVVGLPIFSLIFP